MKESKKRNRQIMEKELYHAEAEQFEARSDIWTPEQREAMLRKHQMEVRVSSFERGLETYIGVKLIRLKSKNFNLLILRGYLPTLGEIDGEVCFVVEEREIKYQDVHGFFILKQNTLYLIIREMSGSGVSTGVG